MKGAFQMRRLLLLSSAVIAIGGLLAAALSTCAFALTLPEILPTSVTELPLTGESEGTVSLVTTGGTQVACERAIGTGTQEPGKPLGLFHTEFKGCRSNSVTCTGLGDPAGVVLVLGQWHLVFDQKTPELLVAILLLPEPVHMTCSALVLVEMKGDEVCLALKATEKAFTHSDHCIQNEGIASDKHYFNTAGEEVAVKLECSTNHAAFKECAELALAKATSSVEEFADI
jgi:hypothetical protein